MSLLDRVRAAWGPIPPDLIAFRADGRVIGHVRPDVAAALSLWPRIFRRDDLGFGFNRGLKSPRERTEALVDVALALYRKGLFGGWRNELYDVKHSWDAAPMFRLERAAVRPFGFHAWAAHLNGFVGGGENLSMWIARRSPTKPIDPNMLDNLVGGGMGSGTTPRGTIVKECREEAGIPVELAEKAQPAGRVQVRRMSAEGLHSETIFVFDLALPEDFQPANQDGEVAQMRLLPIREVIGMLRGDADFTADAALVALSFLLRRGLIPQSEPGYAQLAAARAFPEGTSDPVN